MPHRIACVLMLSAASAISGAEAARVECLAGCMRASVQVRGHDRALAEPFSVAADKQGNRYICELSGNRITRVDPNGNATVISGTVVKAYRGDGGQATEAALSEPHSICIRGDRMFVADTGNHCVRLIDLKTGTITTIAGTGEPGYSGDDGPATKARFNLVMDVDLDADGNRLYIADIGNRRIRVVQLKTGIVKTVAGNGQAGVPEDGADALQAPLDDPRAVKIHPSGAIFILERRSSALRMVDRNGRISTLVGAPNTDFRATPELNRPKYFFVDGKDSLVIADTENHIIRRYSLRDKTLVTIAGTGEKGFWIEPGDPLKTQLNRPHGVYVDRDGSIYVADSFNQRVLKILPGSD